MTVGKAAVPSIIAIATLALILGCVYALLRVGRAQYNGQANYMRNINDLPINIAEKQALSILTRQDIFRCTQQPISDSRQLVELADRLAFLLERYDSIESVAEPNVRIARSILHRSIAHPQYIVIGKGFEGTDLAFEIGVLPRKEAIYELYSNEPTDPTFGTYRSVFHFLLANSPEKPDYT